MFGNTEGAVVLRTSVQGSGAPSTRVGSALRSKKFTLARPAEPKISYLTTLGLNGLESSSLDVVKAPGSWAPKKHLTRRTAKPPTTTTATINSGNHALRTNLDICT